MSMRYAYEHVAFCVREHVSRWRLIAYKAYFPAPRPYTRVSIAAEGRTATIAEIRHMQEHESDLVAWISCDYAELGFSCPDMYVHMLSAKPRTSLDLTQCLASCQLRTGRSFWGRSSIASLYGTRGTTVPVQSAYSE